MQPTRKAVSRHQNLRLATIGTSDRFDDVISTTESSVGGNDATIGKFIGPRICSSTQDYGTPHQSWDTGSLSHRTKLDRYSRTYQKQQKAKADIKTDLLSRHGLTKSQVALSGGRKRA